METEEQKQGGPGNEANDDGCVHILLSDTDSDHLVLQCDAVQYGHTPGTQSNQHGSHEAFLYILPLDAWLVSLLVLNS